MRGSLINDKYNTECKHIWACKWFLMNRELENEKE
jgi:hypothetical protein